MNTRSCTVDLSFPHGWEAEILRKSPMIAPSQHFTYPQAIEEVEIGALEILFQPRPKAAQAMATFALGFADPGLPHGLWSCPNPRQLCAVAGGYGYIVDTDRPETWMQIPYRPVTSVHVAVEQGLLLFAGFHALWALGRDGQAWETARLSWEGLRVAEIRGSRLEGFGWDFASDAEVPFTVDLATGRHSGGAGPGHSEEKT
jgi:hypothetical protein